MTERDKETKQYLELENPVDIYKAVTKNGIKRALGDNCTLVEKPTPPVYYTSTLDLSGQSAAEYGVFISFAFGATIDMNTAAATVKRNPDKTTNGSTWGLALDSALCSIFLSKNQELDLVLLINLFNTMALDKRWK